MTDTATPISADSVASYAAGLLIPVVDLTAGAGLKNKKITAGSLLANAPAASVPGAGFIVSNGTILAPGTIGSGLTLAGGTTLNASAPSVPGAGFVTSNGTILAPGTIGAGLTLSGATLSATIPASGFVKSNGTILAPGTITFADIPTEVQNLPLVIQQAGTMADSQIMMLVPATQTITLPASLTGAGIVFNNGTTSPTGGWPASAATFVVASNNGTAWTTQGTLSVSTGGSLSVVSGPTADVTIAPGGGLRVVAQGTHDTNMKDFGLTLMAKKV